MRYLWEVNETAVSAFKKGERPWLKQWEKCIDPHVLIQATGAKINQGGINVYYTYPPLGSLDGDYISVPKQEQFIDPNEWFIAIFHELAHWSEVRLDWNGDQLLNELIADIVSSTLADLCGIPHIYLNNHEKYYDLWCQRLNDDPAFIQTAARQAAITTNFLLKFLEL